MDIAFTVLSGFIAGALWGWYFATERASKRLEFWRSTAAMAKTEAEFMVKELAEVTAQREAMRSELALLRRDVERRAIKREQAAARKSRENVMKAGEVGREP